MFNNKAVWITGASSGIGLAYAEALHAQGAKLILSALTAEELQPVVERLEGSIPIAFDVADFEALPAIVEQAIKAFGNIDVLINNAGVTQRALAIDTDFSVYRRVIDIDLMAPIALTQLVLPSMLDQGSGRIIVTSSISGKIGAPLRTAYSAAKHGCFGFFDALRSEVEHLGINIHVVAPGSVQTNLARNALTGSGDKFGKTDSQIAEGYTPEYMIEQTLAAIAKGKREIIIVRGKEKFAVYLRRFLPETAFDQIAKATPGIIKAIKNAE